MITLYHGSNMEIDTIDLNRCRPDKDFGQGFYLTDIRKQAEFMALRRTRIMGEGMPMVTVYTFDEASLYDGSLKVKVFDAPCEEWALFVLANRNASISGFKHDYDVVIGVHGYYSLFLAIISDRLKCKTIGVAFQLERYSRKMISLETLVEELTYRSLNSQYFFGTECAISKLQRL